MPILVASTLLTFFSFSCFPLPFTNSLLFSSLFLSPVLLPFFTCFSACYFSFFFLTVSPLLVRVACFSLPTPALATPISTSSLSLFMKAQFHDWGAASFDWSQGDGSSFVGHYSWVWGGRGCMWSPLCVYGCNQCGWLFPSRTKMWRQRGRELQPWRMPARVAPML